MKRYATVRNAGNAATTNAYLPDNYYIIHEFVDRSGVTCFVIEGEDFAGWTLDGYVIPRFASGIIQVEEIDLSHPIMKEVPA